MPSSTFYLGLQNRVTVFVSNTRQCWLRACLRMSYIVNEVLFKYTINKIKVVHYIRAYIFFDIASDGVLIFFHFFFLNNYCLHRLSLLNIIIAQQLIPVYIHAINCEMRLLQISLSIQIMQ